MMLGPACTLPNVQLQCQMQFVRQMENAADVNAPSSSCVLSLFASAIVHSSGNSFQSEYGSGLLFSSGSGEMAEQRTSSKVTELTKARAYPCCRWHDAT